MKNKETTVLLKEVQQKYSRLRRILNASIKKFSKKDDELQTFLFHTLLGEAVRDKILRHIFDKSMLKLTQHESETLRLKCNSPTETLRVFKMLNNSKLNKYLKSEFSVSISAERPFPLNVLVNFE